MFLNQQRTFYFIYLFFLLFTRVFSPAGQSHVYDVGSQGLSPRRAARGGDSGLWRDQAEPASRIPALSHLRPVPQQIKVQQMALHQPFEEPWALYVISRAGYMLQ